MNKFVVLAALCFSFIHHAVATPAIEAYGRLPAVDLMALSPSGKRYALVVTVGDMRNIAVFEAGKLLFSKSLGDIKARDIEWAGEDHLLLTMSDFLSRPLDLTTAHEMFSLIDIDLANRSASSIFDKTQKVANAILGDAGTVKVDGHYFKYFVGLAYGWSKARMQDGHGGYFFDGDHRNLYRVNLDTHEITLEARGGSGPGFKWVVGNDGAVVAHSEFDKATGIWRLYAGEDSAKLLLERKGDGMGDMQLHAQGRRPNTVWITDSSASPAKVEEVSVPDGQRETLFADKRVRHFLYDPDTRLAIGAATSDDLGAMLFERRAQARLVGTRKAFPDLRMLLVSASHDLDQLIVRTDGNDDPGTYWLVDIGSGAANPIGQEYPDISTADVAPTHWFNYKSADGQQIDAVLTLPRQYEKGKKLPLLLMPLSNFSDRHVGIGFNWFAQAFAASGYAVLQPNYRDAAGKQVEADSGQWIRRMQTDLSAGVGALAEQGVVDPRRVCIAGSTYGGYAALAGVTLQQDIYRCAVSINGYSDLFAELQLLLKKYDYNSDTIRSFKLLTGAKNEGDGSLRNISPVNFAERAGAPILLLHATDDVDVLPAQSKSMESALRKAGKPVEFVELKGEDHWLSRDATRKAMLRASVEFVKKYNPPD